jgi:hypothetical protein
LASLEIVGIAGAADSGVFSFSPKGEVFSGLTGVLSSIILILK